ncbi:unnamed protein product [Brassica oleracea var. botrytis]|uniref:Uncharacterized protein n=2 Tax=Brassica TaxID=3705 RepID=A0A3P6AYM3_BRAOL|nr:unnamed protein product [Brassica napus]VDC96147.1 unnamed protein product [Brassica oleracea]
MIAYWLEVKISSLLLWLRFCRFITTSLAKQPWFENIFLWNVAKRFLPLRLLATSEVAAKASGSGMQRMVRRAAQKPVDDRLFTWAAVEITNTILILLLKKFIRSSGFVDES